MPAYANSGKRWIAFVAMVLFVFQALIASFALASSSQGSGEAGVTTIICTPSGPRVITLDVNGAIPDTEQHSGALPHCCIAGCGMLSGAALPDLFLLVWLLPATETIVQAPAAVSPYFASALARLPQRSRAPPTVLA